MSKQVCKNTCLLLIVSILLGSDLLGQVGLHFEQKKKLNSASLWEPAKREAALERMFPDLRLSMLGHHWDSPGRIPLYYSYRHLPFFCRLEVDIEQHSYLPVKIRLGEQRYVDRLEGKERD